MLFKTMSSTKRSTKTSPNAATSTSSSPSYSAEIIATNDDLLNEILLRLPIKSLIKFKSVSRRWLSLISNPDFSRSRNPFPASASGLFFVKNYGSRPEFNFIDLINHNSSPSRPPFRSLTFVDHKLGIRILQSCNGLLLCCSGRAFQPKANYYIYNPTTKHYTILPPLVFPRSTFRKIHGLNLAFDPSNSPHYKVICIRNSDAERGQFQIEIYSSETGPWRLSSNLGSFAADFGIQFNDGIYWNRAVHWFCPSGTSLYFKIDEEQLGEMPRLPVLEDSDDLNRMLSYFGESRDHLHFVDHVHDPGEIRFNVYEMERDYSRWYAKYRVDLSRVSTAFPETIPSDLFHQLTLQYHLLSVLCVMRGEIDEDSYLVFAIPSKVLRHNFKTGTLDILFDIKPAETEGSEISLVSYVYEYFESLACV